MVSPSLGDAGTSLHILTETVVKHLFDLLQASSSLGDYILTNCLNPLSSLMDSLFMTVFPQLGKHECEYLLDLIKKGKLFCMTLLEQGASKAHMGNLNEACLLNDALPYLALMNGCTTQLDFDPDCPQLKLQIDNQTLNAVLDTGAKVTIMNKKLFDPLPKKCKTPLLPSILCLVATNQSEIDNLGISDITFQLGNTTFTHRFIVSKSLSQDVLLGIDFVYANQIKLLYHDDHSPYLEFGDQDNIDLVERSCVEVTVKLAETG